LYSNIGLATIALLYHQGVKVVLPPSYLCCGYPQKSNGYEQKANAMVTDNRVLFHRMANTLNYLDIKHILTSCGTCIDQLITYELGDIFKNSSLTDMLVAIRFLWIATAQITGWQHDFYPLMV
jgi:Fe-S oxidoreductase